MSNNVLVMREEELDEFVGGMKKTYSELETTGSDIPNRLAYLKRANLFEGGINKIAKQVNSISNSILNVQWMMQEHNRSFFEMERNLAKAASGIEIPTGYNVNNSMQVNVVASVGLNKNDGRSVNEGQALYDIDEVADSSIKTMQKLGNIKNDVSQIEQNVDESTLIKHENLSNINNDVNQKEQNVDESTNINRTNVNSINNNINQDVQSIDTGTNIKSSELEDIGNSENLTPREITSRIADIESGLKSFSDIER